MKGHKEQKDLLPGTLEMLILQTLRRGALHGYAIAQDIQQISEDVLQVEEGSLYPALQRLLIQGWLVGEWGRTAENRRARYYTITAAGRRQLAQEIAAYQRVTHAIGAILRPA